MAVNGELRAPASAGRNPAPTEAYATGGPRPGPRGTLTRLFFEAVDRFDRPDALQHKVGGEWRKLSHKDVLTRVRRAALGLGALGIKPGDRVAILSENRPEWAIADYACLTAGVTDVPVYPNLPPDQVAYILRDAGVVAAFVSNAEQAAKVAAARAELPALRHVIAFDPGGVAGADLTLGAVEARGAEQDVAGAAERHRAGAMAIEPDDLATILYTSGTTGEPKGVMLTHDNIFSNVQAACVELPNSGTEVALSFLPLSHIFERTVGHYYMWSTGTSIAYAESIDAVAANMGEVRPTLAAAVPRVYEKIYARVLDAALGAGGLKKRIFLWARGVGERWAETTLAGGAIPTVLGLQYRVADRLVFAKLRQRVGGRMRYFVSGGAPLATEINKFFYAAGLTILEGYGLSETSPIIAANTPRAFRMGTVGKPFEGVEVAIAEDGEILTRGPHVMRGYYNRPEATREAIDADGWFHTGDIGELREGYLTITDRKKDLIVTAGGKNIAPQPIENRVRTNRFVSQAVMIGDRRSFPCMLVVPDWEQLERWTKAQGITAPDRATLLVDARVRAKMESEVQQEVATFARYEQPKKIALLEHDFTIDRGELTPKLSVRRKVVDRMYREQIDALYADPEGASHG